jgi:hypothetical protein
LVWKIRINTSNLLLSGKKLTFIVLIVLPFIFVISYDLQLVFFAPFSSTCPPPPYPNWKPTLSAVVTYFGYSLYILIVVFYPPYPLPFFRSIKQYFESRGYKSAVEEYELTKKFLYVAVISLLVTFAITVIADSDYNQNLQWTTWGKKTCVKTTSQWNKITWAPELLHTMTKVVEYHREGFRSLQVFLGLIAIGCFLKILFAVWRPAFRLYFAKGCFSLIGDRRNEAEKMKFFVKGLDSYNSYLRRQITLEIGDLKKIYSQIACSSVQDKNDLMNKVCTVFEKDMLEYDTLEPLRVISRFLKENDPQRFLTQEPIFSKIKNFASFAILAIPVILSVLQAVHNAIGH